MLSFAVYSAPFLLVDIIFPVKVQGELWKEYIKKSFRISRSPITTRSEGVYDLSKESTMILGLGDKVIPITSMENFDSAVDYVIPSPGTELSPVNSEGRDDSIDLDMSMNMSLEAEKLFDLHLPGLALKGQPPFDFDDDDPHSPESPFAETFSYRQRQQQREDTSRRLSSFATNLGRSASKPATVAGFGEKS